jgi:hypothetical protein
LATPTLQIWASGLALQGCSGGVSKARKVASIDIVETCRRPEKGRLSSRMRKIAVATAKAPRARATTLVGLRPDIAVFLNVSAGIAVGALKFFGMGRGLLGNVVLFTAQLAAPDNAARRSSELDHNLAEGSVAIRSVVINLGAGHPTKRRRSASGGSWSFYVCSSCEPRARSALGAGGV